jgi:hypothetical protein
MGRRGEEFLSLSECDTKRLRAASQLACIGASRSVSGCRFLGGAHRSRNEELGAQTTLAPDRVIARDRTPIPASRTLILRPFDMDGDSRAVIGSAPDGHHCLQSTARLTSNLCCESQDLVRGPFLKSKDRKIDDRLTSRFGS